MVQEKIYVNRKLVQGTILFTLGIVLGYYTNFSLLFSLVLLAGFFFLGAYCLFYELSLLKTVIYCFLIVFGLFWFDVHDPQPGILQQWENGKVEVTGKVLSLGTRDNQYILQLTTVNGHNLSLKPRVVVNTSWEDNQIYGWNDLVKFTGILEEPLPQTNPGGFSEKEFWRQKGVYYELNVLGKGVFLEKGKGIKAAGYQLREKINHIIEVNLPEKEGGVVRGLVLGDKSKLDSELYERAQELGIVHIFAVSGLHVGFVVALYLFIAKSLRLSDTLTLSGAVLILLVYSLVTGLTTSVTRASIMTVLGLIGLKWLKYRDFYTLLAGAALVILLANPLNLLSIGFQLSFISTWGLVYFFSLGEDLFPFFPEKIRKTLAVPVAAQLASLPIVIYHFNLLSFWAPLVNIIIVPLVGILVPLLFLALSISLVAVKLAEPFLLLGSGIVYGLFFLIEFISDLLSRGFMYIEKPPLVLIIFYYILLIGCREAEFLREKISLNKRMILSIVLTLSLLLICLPRSEPLKAVFLDVGQGDGAVLKTPYNQYIVVDGGPGSSTLTRYLQSAGVNRVLLIILSHPDSDHINGLFQVIKKFPTDFLLVPPEFAENPAFTEFKNLARSKNTRIVEGREGVNLRLASGVYLKVLSPNPDLQKNLDTNEGSLVVRVSWQEKDILFTGDIGITTIKNILGGLEGIEVVKVPHHGSRNSYFPGLYSFLSPDIAVISAGRNNRFNHPHQEVIEGIQGSGGVILRTDQKGAITLIFQENDIVVDTKL